MHKVPCIQNTLVRIITNCNKYKQAPPIFKRLHWLQVEFCCILKTATLMCRFLHSGHPSYFGYLLYTHCRRCSTKYKHPNKRFLEVLQFYPSVHESNYFGHSFAFDTRTVWTDLSYKVCFVPSLICFRKRLKITSLHEGFPNFACTLSSLSVVMDLATTMA